MREILRDDIKDMDKEELLSPSTMMQILDIEDTVDRLELMNVARIRASDLRCKTLFDENLKVYNKMVAQETVQKNTTNFNCPGYKDMYCGGWVADQEGIRIFNPMTNQYIIACHHPIIPVKRLRNMETGEEQITIAYHRNGTWSEKTVSKEVVASSSKIVKLSAYGVSVTSENARDLVRFLSDVENYNDADIPILSSTSKMGWHGNDFIPYNGDILFDGDARFKQLYESITQHGTLGAWLTMIAELRQKRRFEFLFVLAASFASVLIHKIKNLPFFVDLYGETEGGKTVTLMIAASVWADPSEGKFIGDFKSTEVGLEAKADMLNHLPMLLDDTSKTSGRIKDNFEGVIYDLCSGKGKTRSNRDLGLNRENHWENLIITNGERPLISYAGQGGALNRVIEVECKEGLYEDAPVICDVVKKNFGHAGKEFVRIIQENYSEDDIRELFDSFCDMLYEPNKATKQTMSVASVLVADKILSEHLFKDGIQIELENAKDLLMDYQEISDGQRCYEMIMDAAAANPFRFDSDDDEPKTEQWGIINDGYIKFIPSMLSRLCDKSGFKFDSFKKWALGKGYLIPDSNGKLTRSTRFHGKTKRLVWIRVAEEDDHSIDWEKVDFDFPPNDV